MSPGQENISGHSHHMELEITLECMSCFQKLRRAMSASLCTLRTILWFL